MTCHVTLRARDLRRTASLAQRRLWTLLRRRQTGYRFRRQEPVGPWMADFLCHRARLVIEVPGAEHRDGIIDHGRVAGFAQRGFRVLRFSEEEVLANPDAVWQAILDALPPPS